MLLLQTHTVMQFREFTHPFGQLLPCVVIGTNLMTNAVWLQSATNGLSSGTLWQG